MAWQSTIKANNTGSRARRKGAKKNRKHGPGEITPKTKETMKGGQRYYSKVQTEKTSHSKKHNLTTTRKSICKAQKGNQRAKQIL